MNAHNPPHPGQILSQYLNAVSITKAAGHFGMTRAMLSRILNGHSGISVEFALKLSESLDTPAEMWLDLQTRYDLWDAGQRSTRRKLSRLSLD